MPDPGTVRSHHPQPTPTRPVTDGEQTGLPHALTAVPDPRSPRGLRYPLAGLLAVALGSGLDWRFTSGFGTRRRSASFVGCSANRLAGE